MAERPVATHTARVGALDPQCVLCGRPVPDQAYACTRCASLLDQDLVAAVDLVAELETTAARLSRLSRTPGRVAGTPLPVDLHAAGLRSTLVNTLVTWARHVAEERGQQIPDLPTCRIGPVCHRPDCLHTTCVVIRLEGRPGPVAVAVHWLRGNSEWIRHRREVAELADGIGEAVRAARRGVDLPPDRSYVGTCQCGLALYARPGSDAVACRGCDTVWGVDEQREWMLLVARDSLASAAAISRALTALGQPVAAGTIRQWGNRRRLPTYGRLVIHPGALYRVGDVLDLAQEPAQQPRRGRVA